MKTLITLLTLFCAYTTVAQETGRFAIYFNDEGGNQRQVVVDVPEDYDHHESYPVIVAAHAAGQSPTAMLDMLQPATEKLDAIVISGDENGYWDAASLTGGYQWILQNYAVDTERVYITGYVEGGYWSMLIGLGNPGMFAGAIAIGSSGSTLNDPEWENIQVTPVAVILGDQDPDYTDVSNLLNEMDAAGCDLLRIDKEGVGRYGDYYSSLEFADDWLLCWTHVTGESVANNVPALEYPDRNGNSVAPVMSFSWRGISNAEQYELEVSSDSEFNSVVATELVSGTQAHLSLEHDHEYFWRVRAQREGEWQPYSQHWRFQTSGQTGSIEYYQSIEYSPFDGETREFAVWVPEDYDPEHVYPIIIGLHGFGMTSSFFRDLMIDAARQKNAILVCPDGKGNQHDDEYNGNEISIVSASIYFISEQYNVSYTDIYLAGFSYGGREALYWGLTNAGQIKGIVALSPAIQSMGDANNEFAYPWPNPFDFTGARDLPICVLYGEEDEYYIDFIEEMNDNLRAENGRFFSKIEATNHDVVTIPSFTENMLECIRFIDGLTDVEELDVQVHMYPNPTHEKLTITTDNSLEASIKVIDVAGRTRLKTSMQGSTSTIDVTTLQNGVYTVMIENEVGRTSQKITIAK